VSAGAESADRWRDGQIDGYTSGFEANFKVFRDYYSRLTPKMITPQGYMLITFTLRLTTRSTTVACVRAARLFVALRRRTHSRPP
jgi:hypothetical protein